MEDPTAVTALEPIGKTTLIDPAERRLLLRARFAAVRLGFAIFVAVLGTTAAIINPLPWFIIQSVLLFGYAVLNGVRFDHRARELDDYRLERHAQGLFGPRSKDDSL